MIGRILLALAVVCLLWLPTLVTAQPKSPEELRKELQQVKEAVAKHEGQLSKQSGGSTYVAPAMSAIAALCSAFIAFLVYQIHHENRVDVVRAEVILHGWKVDHGDGKTFLLIEKASNVGKGPALSFGVIANNENGSRIHWEGENFLRDIRSEQEINNLALRIPLECCVTHSYQGNNARLVLRLFWTDLHEKKHLVDLLLHIDLNSDSVALIGTEAHILSWPQRIFMIKRKADWFNSDSKFRAALNKPIRF